MLGRGWGESACKWEQTRGQRTDRGNLATSRWTDDPGAVWREVVWCVSGADERVGVGASG